MRVAVRRTLVIAALLVGTALAPAPAPAGIVPSGTVQIPLTGGNGSGRVTSSPAGMDCVYSTGDRSGICTYVFTSSSLEPVDVVLTYTPSAGNLVSRGGSTQPGPASTTIRIADLGQTYSAPVDWTFVLTTHLVTVTTSGAGTGRVVSGPLGIDCGSICSQSFDYGTPMSLTATPAAGSAFSAWTGACAGQPATCTFVLTQQTTAEAVFDLTFAGIPGALVGDAVVDVDVRGWRWLPRAEHQAKQPRILELQLTARERLSASLTLRRPPRERGRILARDSFRVNRTGAVGLRLLGIKATEPKGRAFLEGTLTDANRNRLFVRCAVVIPDGLNGRTTVRRCAVTNPIQRRHEPRAGRFRRA
jgi:hypothetical protein